eukprot:TRINITY_DN47803_c0_g1_i1.p1 TRINITY_DN47803_c0_g1~~TRINITY_DN47803_c0_g1_i1.p1  ORF type:complete len:830 (-),score=127.49 TRINITY_DN47803_c0_g1_i1:63-2552(-)
MLGLLGHTVSGPLKALYSRSLPEQGTLQAPLAQPDSAEVSRDEYGIPHIKASTEIDEWFLLGLVHAQDRMWQIHASRRLAQGRLSEFAGPKALPLDTLARQVGWYRLAEEDWASRADWKDPDAEQMVKAYAQGVTWGMEHCRMLPLEFHMTKQRPEPWTPVDTCALSRLYSFVMNFGFQATLIRQAMLDLFGEDAQAWLHTSEDEPKIPYTVNAKAVDAFKQADLGGLTDQVLAAAPGQGSNWWAVHGRHTETGKPLLVGDPHLKLNIPCFWYEVHLNGPIKAYGAGPPGIPGLFVAQNGFLCSSVTLGYCDVEDVWLEHLEGDTYEDEGGIFKQLSVRSEVIDVKGAPSVTVRCRSMTRGAAHPVLLEGSLQRLAAAVPSDCGLAYYGISMRPRTKALKGLRDMLLARSFKQFDAGLALADICNLNIGYADVDGHIGYVLTGPVPRRSCKPGREQLPLHGWEGHKWCGYLPHQDMPKAFDPPEGYLISANHKIVDSTYPHYLGQIWKSGYRAQAIEEELTALFARGKVSVPEMQRLQLNVRSCAAIEFVKEARSVTPDTDTAEALALLTTWDGELAMESVPASLYQLTHQALVEELFAAGFAAKGQDTDTSLLQLVCGVGFDEAFLVKIQSALQGHLHLNVIRMLRDGSWWLEQVGGKDKAINAAVRSAVGKLEELAGKDWVHSPTCAWGKLHVKHLQHSISKGLGLPPGSQPLDLPSHEAGGDTNTINQAAVTSSNDLSSTGGSQASLRVIWDLSDLTSGCRMITVPGVSGQFNSPHYGDQLATWLAGQLRPVRTTDEAIAASTVSKTRFGPAKKADTVSCWPCSMF